MQLTRRPGRRADATAPARTVDFKELVWWLAELTLDGETPTAKQIRDRFGCSRSASYRWAKWLSDKKRRLRPRPVAQA